MARQLVENSSTIKAIEHFPETDTLHVEFHSGHKYEYPEFPYEQYASFCEAESKGKHFAAFIRNRKDSEGNPIPVRKL